MIKHYARIEYNKKYFKRPSVSFYKSNRNKKKSAYFKLLLSYLLFEIIKYFKKCFWRNIFLYLYTDHYVFIRKC